MAWYHRMVNVGRTTRLNREIDREQAFHLAERVDELVAAGWERGAAEREARRRFGNPTYQRERTRDADVARWAESLARDVRHAGRGLARAPVFTAVAVLSLALGIGANTAIFTLIEAVVLRPLPVPAPEELVVVGYAGDSESMGPPFTNPLWEALRDRQTGMAAVAAFSERGLQLRRPGAAAGEVERVAASLVGGDYFGVFGVLPAAGRLLTREDDVRGCTPVAVLGNGYWQRALGGDPAVVGRALEIEGVAVEVVGVTRPGFTGAEVGRESELYLPLCAQPLVSRMDMLDGRSTWWLRVMGRREAGLSVSQLGARLESISPAVFEATVPENYSVEHKEEYRGRTLTATAAPRGLSGLRDQYGPALTALMAGVGLVLLIACANVANLLLARSTARERELAIRAAIGAGRGRLTRQMLTESLLLAVAGAALGLLLARWGAQGLTALLDNGRDAVALDLSLNLRVLAFTTVVAVATVLLFGLVPAWRAGRVDPQTTMAAHGRGVARGHSRFTLGKALVAGQVALSLVLLAGAGLLVTSLRNLVTQDPGFTADRVLVADVDASRTGLAGEALVGIRNQLVERVRSIPGVRSASASFRAPLGNTMWNDLLVVEGFTPADERDALVWFNETTSGYFETLGTRFLAGRDFGPEDVPGGTPVAIVSESVAQKFFGGDALGKTYRTPVRDSLTPPTTVIGVVEDAKYGSLREESSRTVYTAASQAETSATWMTLEVRTDGDPSALARAVSDAVAEVHPRISVTAQPLTDQLARTLRRERMLAVLSALFAAVALLLAMLGLYGVMAYAVARRRNEIGVRIALGADRARMLRMVLGDAGRVLAVGLVAGAVGAMFSGRLVATFLFGLSPVEPVVLATAAGLLAAAALTAAALPAWRAARLDPVAALREE